MSRIFAFILFILFSATSVYAAAPMSESKKIDAMLHELGASNVTFMRNGEAHDGKWGEDHLRKKYGEMRGQVKTAQDFVNLVATQSRETNKPYLIKTEDGKTEPAAKWFQDRLVELDGQ